MKIVFFVPARPPVPVRTGMNPRQNDLSGWRSDGPP